MTEIVCYHGTRKPYQRHGLLLGRAFHGGAPTTAPVNPGRQPLPDSDQWVYFTTDLDLAWSYAWLAAGRGRPRVLTIAPSGTVERDPEHSIEMNAWRCQQAYVLEVDLNPRITAEEAAAGWC